MKTKIIIAAATLATALFVQYLRKRKTITTAAATPAHKRTHHLTDVFAHAKEQAGRL